VAAPVPGTARPMTASAIIATNTITVLRCR
jgi:hypothetical protein